MCGKRCTSFKFKHLKEKLVRQMEKHRGARRHYQMADIKNFNGKDIGLERMIEMEKEKSDQQPVLCDGGDQR